MTPQEQQMIDGLIQRVNGTNLPDKDPEAEQHLQQGFSSNPNALYILSQTVLVQQYALDQAKQQLDALKSQLAQARQTQTQQTQQPPQKHTGFLESIFGSRDDDNRPAPPPPQIQGYTPVQTSAPIQAQPYTPPPTYAPPAGYAPAPTMGGGGGFLRSAAQTAAGVAAGALAFQGVESLLHGFGNNMVGGGGSGLGGFGAGAPREEVVNNYYGDAQGNGENRDDSRGFDNGNDNNPGDNIFTDSNDRSGGDDSSNFADTGDDSSNQDDSSFGDDSGSTDDSGSFDDGGSDLGNDNSF